MTDTVADVLADVVARLGASPADAVLIERGCKRATHVAAVNEVARHWGSPASLDTNVGALLDLLASNYGEAMVAPWRRGPIIAYLCWRRGPHVPAEFFCGAHAAALLPHLFLNPLIFGHNHAVRTSELH